MALYLKTAGGNWSAAATWSTTGSGGADNSGPPTAATDVIMEAGSGPVTIDAGAVCRSLNHTSGTGSYTGTMTHTNAVTLSIGDGTAGAGNVALKINSGCTYAPTVITCILNFVSTSATQQTIDTGGKNVGSVTFNGAGGSWQFSTNTNSTITTSSAFTLTRGSVDLNGKTYSTAIFVLSNSNTRSLTLGAATINLNGSNFNVWDMTTTTGLTFSGASATINCSGAGATFTGNGQSFGTLSMTGSGNCILASVGAGCGTFATLSRTGTAVKTDGFIINSGTGPTVTGTLLLAGNSATNRLFIRSNTLGTAITITNTGATMTWAHVDFRDITLTTAFNASAITGNSGDRLGNTNITFTTSATQTYNGTTGNWSTAASWTSRVPLPQDDVIIGAFGGAGRTLTIDMPCIGRDIDCSGVTNSPTLTKANVITIYGSLTLASGMTFTVANFTVLFENRTAKTLTCAGKNLYNVSFSMFGGTMTLQDTLTANSETSNLFNGTLTTNNNNMSLFDFNISGTGVRTLNLGSSTVTVSRATTNVWNATTTTNLTLNAGTSTIQFNGNGNFVGGGLTYSNINFNPSSTGTVIVGSNTFNTFTISAAKTVKFTPSTTTTLQSFVATGSAGNVITIDTSTGAGTFTLSDTAGTNTVHYCSITRSIASGGAIWDATDNCTNGGSNTGWTFTSGVSPGYMTTGKYWGT